MLMYVVSAQINTDKPIITLKRWTKLKDFLEAYMQNKLNGSEEN